MVKAKKILGVSVFLVLVMALAAVWFVFLANNDAATSATDSKNAVPATARLIKTEEKNFSYPSAVSYITLQQSDLFHMSDIIFVGTHTRSENYTYVQYEDGEEYHTYYTFHYFVIKDIYYGDETLLGKEIPLVQRNIKEYSETSKYEIVLKKNADYLMFSYKHTDPELEKAAKTPIYLISLWQSTFELSSSNVFITHELFGRNTQEKRVDRVVSDFMDSWVTKQFSEKDIVLDTWTTPEDSRNQAGDGESIFNYENIDDVRQALDIREVNVQTDVGAKNRLSIKKSTLDDFLYAGIQYYIIDRQAPGGGYAYGFVFDDRKSQ